MSNDVLSLFSEPTSRKLRIFAFDPSLSAQYDMAAIGEITIPVLWEENLKPGPVGEYIQVVDADPASSVFYRPVNLDEKWILAQNGLAPSETNPLFHQQMVYAVAMTTIAHFEQALGRVALWSAHRDNDNQHRFVRHLRIYPHALRDRNAYYSPEKKALLFGYFPVGIKDANNTPGTLVFTCLSHDIIAHETTHALLDGVHPRFNEPINPDVLAFHEAFADIVALFQHFSYPGILRDQIARTRGDLGGENLLGQLAQQFGKASGRGTALRDALGGPDEKGVWRSHKPDVRKIERTTEPHDRGAVLVAAVFGAFLKVYRARVTDLYRIASEGTGVLRAGEIPPDLANRLADEAARAAQYVLQMCIRAIDYCPPVGITFGDYLRAIVTGDYELNPDDPFGYRLAFIESFRQWGIHPRSMRSMSLEALLWPTRQAAEEEARSASIADEELRSLFKDEQPVTIAEQTDGTPSKRTFSTRLKPWNLESDRLMTWNGAEDNAAVLWAWLMKGRGKKLLPTIGIVVYEQKIPATVFRSRKTGLPSVEVHSVRTALRRSPRGGAPVTDLVVEITQRR
ncbi:MAG: peptidase S8, partial [Gemmatimonadaceae bacterium]|nr:peptidase S8 [Gemmatimonadaceae bacterium]